LLRFVGEIARFWVVFYFFAVIFAALGKRSWGREGGEREEKRCSSCFFNNHNNNAIFVITIILHCVYMSRHCLRVNVRDHRHGAKQTSFLNVEAVARDLSLG